MKRNNYNTDFIDVAYSNSNLYYGSGHVTEYGNWMSEEESASYYDIYCAKIYRDVNRRASSMRI